MFLHNHNRQGGRLVGDIRLAAPSGQSLLKRVLRVALSVFGVASALYALPVDAAVLSGKADAFLTKKATRRVMSGWTSVIVKVDGNLTPQREAEIQSIGGDVYRHLPIIKSVAVRVPNRNLERLAALPYITNLSADLIVRKTDAFTTTHSLSANAWASYPKVDPTHVLVGIVDSGINKVSDVQNLTFRQNGLSI